MRKISGIIVVIAGALGVLAAGTRLFPDLGSWRYLLGAILDSIPWLSPLRLFFDPLDWMGLLFSHVAGVLGAFALLEQEVRGRILGLLIMVCAVAGAFLCRSVWVLIFMAIIFIGSIPISYSRSA